MYKILSLLTLAALLMSELTVAGESVAVDPSKVEPYTPAPENLSARETFQDNKFGVFLHWGLYSQLGGVGSPYGAEWIMEDLRISGKKYQRLAQFFNPTGFDAEEWVRAFKDAGAKYIVITSKHHDGFSMYDSKVSDYDIVDSTPYGQDPIKALAEAAHKNGLALFFYYSQLDWHHPDYYPWGRTGHYTKRAKSGDWEKYLQFQDAQLTELLTQYGPIGGIWFDGWWDQEDSLNWDKWQLQRTYKMIHQLQPATLIVNNHHRFTVPGEDYQGFEQQLPTNQKRLGKLPLEMAQTMNGSWGFSLTDDNYKSAKELVQTLVSAAGRNSNYLLNTGPMPNGKLQPENLQTFAEMGKWLRKYGTSIYKTRGGPIKPQSWGVTTQNKDSIFVHILNWQGKTLEIELDTPIKSAQLLATNEGVKFNQKDGVLTLENLVETSDDWVRVIELKIK